MTHDIKGNVDDTLTYLDNLRGRLLALNMNVQTNLIPIDEEKIARIVAEKMRRDMGGKTTESIGI